MTEWASYLVVPEAVLPFIRSRTPGWSRDESWYEAACWSTVSTTFPATAPAGSRA